MTLRDEAIRSFDRLAKLMEISGANKFKVAAYQRAARSLKANQTDLETADQKTLAEIDGIGKSTAEKIIELRETGSIADLDELMSKVPNGLLKVAEVPGLGPKTVRLLWTELDVTDLDGLRAVLEDDRILTLPRMGEKAAEKLKSSLAFLEQGQDRLPIGIARPVADEMIEYLLARDAVLRAETAGSLRRGRDTIGDIDILAVAEDNERAAEVFCTAPSVHEVIVRGETKCSARVEVTSDGGRWGAEPGRLVQMDLRLVPASAWGAALMYFTGSKAHNVALRERSLKRGLTLNEYGLFPEDAEDDTPPQSRGVEPVAAETEEEIYRSLDVRVVEPELREDLGELDNETPDELIEQTHIVAELHSHTTASDGKMSILESAEIAKSRGFHTLAITDHSQSAAIAGGLSPDRLWAQIDEVREANEQIEGITILAGSEVDILADGSLDYEDDLLAALDVVVASPHVALDLKDKAATDRLLRAIEHPLVHIIGHPTGRLINRRSGMTPDIDTIAAAAAEHDVALEINSHWMRLDLRDEHVRRAVAHDAKIAIDCDVHHPDDYDNIRYGVQTARRGWVERSRCVNTWDADALHTWLRSKRP